MKGGSNAVRRHAASNNKAAERAAEKAWRRVRRRGFEPPNPYGMRP